MTWDNFGDVSPWHGQLWIKDAFADSDQDFAECVEIIGPGDLESLADNQVLIVRGSVYIPLHDDKAMADRLSVIGKTPSLATWIDKALASHAYSGIDEDIFDGQTVIQIGKYPDVTFMRYGSETKTPDVILHGNASLSKYVRDNYLT